ncbi:amidohydrolase family protein [Maribacter polysiphoniae]|uniref:Amidohydrolase family protein n=1 Tax=Maribacter polysiphoniae TaxID=429344 RepID=A0A316DZV4_9FLAO|nr:amidohydrolase family protein [Maribacter polysiphoniae]MBD1261425.1 amidohydrolase family protein [Maribacter polysiphoniae]PWK22759.1 putative TIM-barrel fold metal-dependent hydrolase [Maribacter polysiphoniae]
MRAQLLSIVLIVNIFSVAMGQEDILLKDYNPKSIYKTHKTVIEMAKFPVIDIHSHAYATSQEEIEEWVKTMDKFGIEKTTVLTKLTGKAFDSVYNIYAKYEGRFEVWCGFDYTGYTKKGWARKAVRELERCYEVGARGVGELGDKGEGLLYSKPTAAYGMHIDDERLKPLLEKCGELGMPINIHIAEPYWMYEPIDVYNDGLMNAADWQIDTSNKDLLLHSELINTLRNAVKDNPKTTFIACHFANCSYDLGILGELLDNYPNLYADIAARYAETAPVPRYTKAFYEKYQDRLLYGTDMGFDASMYELTFRILETEDEHFYAKELFGYHWSLYGLGLSDTVLKKIYYENAKKIRNYE